MFLKLIELLSKYDPVLAAHTNGIKAQNQNKRLQFHYLSPSSQNEFINLCGREVQNKILDEVRDANYFSIIVDATPDVSHHEQIILAVRLFNFSRVKLLIRLQISASMSVFSNLTAST